jgi:hypothetical protein
MGHHILHIKHRLCNYIPLPAYSQSNQTRTQHKYNIETYKCTCLYESLLYTQYTSYRYKIVKVKLKFTLEQVAKAQRGRRHAPAALPPGRTRYPLYRRLGGPQGRSGRVRKFSPQPGFDPRTVHPVAIRCTV